MTARIVAKLSVAQGDNNQTRYLLTAETDQYYAEKHIGKNVVFREGYVTLNLGAEAIFEMLAQDLRLISEGIQCERDVRPKGDQ